MIHAFFERQGSAKTLIALPFFMLKQQEFLSRRREMIDLGTYSIAELFQLMASCQKKKLRGPDLG
jgi:hypothetical protein